MIERVCFHFLDTCNMDCPYCYCPFQHKPVRLDVCLSIVDRCASLGIRVITFGGGDPFAFPDFKYLAEHAVESQMKVHVDTNGICLRERDYPWLEKNVHLLALPLDGPDRQVHGKMRGSDQHFDTVLKHLRGLAPINIRK